MIIFQSILEQELWCRVIGASIGGMRANAYVNHELAANESRILGLHPGRRKSCSAKEAVDEVRPTRKGAARLA
jgi:hypothetical protein